LSSNSIEKQIIAYQQLITNLEYDLKTSKEYKQKLVDEITSYEEIKKSQQIKYDNLVTNSSSLINKINSLYYQIKSLDEKIENEFANNAGTKAIVENKKGLKGIVGVVKDFIQVNKQYETAITIALGRSANFIITETENDSKNAIEFLKANKAGKATFLPLTLVKSRPIRDEFITIAQQIEGYINIASNLISFDAKYSNLFSMLLDRIFVTEDLTSAITLSKYTKSNYQIVTIDGQTISVGGAITGGYNKAKIVSIFNLEDNKKQFINELDELNKQHAEIKIDQTKIKANLDETINKINEKKILLGNYEDKIKNYESNLYRYKTDYEQINKGNKTDTSKQLSVSYLNKELAELQAKKDKIVQELNVARTAKLNNRQIADDYQARLDETHNIVNKAKAEQANAEINFEKANAVINNAKEKINLEYHMTVDNAIAN
jgi:chromosome segregation protein